jgi:hypothetical protein
MSKKPKIVLNRGEVRSHCLRSPEIESIVGEITQGILSRVPAEKGYEADVQVGATRVVGMVKATTPHAINENKKNNTLLKALR